MGREYTVEIPEAYLLGIAAYGSLGGSKTAGLTQVWAEKECERLGLHDQLVELQNRNLERLSRILGKLESWRSLVIEGIRTTGVEDDGQSKNV